MLNESGVYHAWQRQYSQQSPARRVTNQRNSAGMCFWVIAPSYPLDFNSLWDCNKNPVVWALDSPNVESNQCGIETTLFLPLCWQIVLVESSQCGMALNASWVGTGLNKSQVPVRQNSTRST